LRKMLEKRKEFAFEIPQSSSDGMTKITLS